MDGEAGWWTTSGNIGLPPLARAMGVGRQQHISASAKLFLESVVKIPSHYCGAETAKQYLEPVFETCIDLYREYQLFCNQKDLPVASLTMLKLVLK